MHFNEILGENAVTQCPNEQKTFKSMQETKTYPSSLFMCYVDFKNQYQNWKQGNPKNVCYSQFEKNCVLSSYDAYDNQRITFQNSVATKRVTSANPKRWSIPIT